MIDQARRTSSAFGVAFALAWPWLGACEASPCDEDVRAQVIEQRVSLELGDETIEAELADEAVERERGWMHRRCGLEGLLLVPDARGELPVWGCGLTAAVDLHWLRDGAVVDVTRELAPCGPSCDGCPIVGEGLEIDAVLETPAGALSSDVGAMVVGLP